ncbi:MAG TPA: penicillin-binding transpeptidase domain-containing protein [Acidimicrobiales bacterium]|nr:penicillin-binding transpeptidase domain-containing protein [Acidimicrobiales bacterium]
MTRSWLVGVGVLALVAALAGVGFTLLSGNDAPGPTREIDAYLRAWERFDVGAMARLTDRPGELGPAVTAMKDNLRVTKARFVARAQERDGDSARAPFTAELELAGLGTWSYRGQLDLARAEGRWRVRWTPAALHPALRPGQTLAVTRSWPERAPILGADGAPLIATGEAILVGLQPGRIRSQAEVEEALERVLDLPPAKVRAALAQPWVRPDLFVPVTDLSAERFASVRGELDPVPGVFFQRGEGRLAVAEGSAAPLLGRVGEVTAERLEELGMPYVGGDTVGLSGIERSRERQLAGTPSGEVQVREAGGRVVQSLHRFPGSAPQAVRLTLHAAVQQAAEQALEDVRQPAALVAVDSATGEVRAVASRPASEEFNRALAGQYPPGSTLKIVTAAGLLGGGLRPEETVPCPAETTAGGRKFVNFESGALGPVPFATAFAQSCNTAFVTLSTRLSEAALVDAAEQFGFGTSYEVGVPVAATRFPVPGDATERAAAAIGQGRVLATPLHMASVAAAVSSGTWRAPRLLADGPPGETKPLDGAVAATLRSLMERVVREGTGTGAARPGQVIGGKTGTAEFGSGNPPPTHAWFVGFRGPLAFALVVEGGGVGGRVAAPLAARFLDLAPR